MKKLESPTFYFEAEVEGDFPEYLFPVEFELQLKVGARVMFIKMITRVNSSISMGN